MKKLLSVVLASFVLLSGCAKQPTEAETKLEQMRSRIRTAEEEELNKLFDIIIEENIAAFEELAK